MTIDTMRLRLSPFSPAHLLALIEGEQVFEERCGVRLAPGMREFFVSDDVSPQWLEMLRASTVTDPWVHGFAVLHAEHEVVIGSAGFKGAADDAGIVEIAYGIVPAYRDQGYATEAVEGLLEFASGHDQVRTVRAHTLPEDNASAHVLKNCGFDFVGEIVDPEDGRVWRWQRAIAPVPA